MDDLSLIERIQAHDQEAMRTLHQQYVDLVYSITYRVLSEATAAEEATQDAFMKVWQSAASFDHERGSLIGWLARIARNTAIDHLRLYKRKVGLDNSLDAAEESHTLPLPDNWQDRERLQTLRMALEDLPHDQAQALALSYFGGMSQSEIAEDMKIPLGTVKTRMRLGLQKLKETWGKN